MSRYTRRSLLGVLAGGTLTGVTGCLAGPGRSGQPDADETEGYPDEDCLGNTLGEPRLPQEGDLEVVLTLDGDGKGNIHGERVRIRNTTTDSLALSGYTIEYASGHTYDIHVPFLTPRQVLAVVSTDVVEGGLDQCPRWMIRDAGFDRAVLRDAAGDAWVEIVTDAGTTVGRATA